MGAAVNNKAPIMMPSFFMVVLLMRLGTAAGSSFSPLRIEAVTDL
jgi:hypothetical protein